MKLIAALALSMFSFSTMAGDVSQCNSLKLKGSYSCEYQGETLQLRISNKNSKIVVSAVTENESFVIDGQEHNRYDWSEQFTYNSHCTADALVIESKASGSLDAIMSLRKSATGGLSYTIEKAAGALTLDCRKL